MGFLFSGVFWGGVLVLLGIAMIIKVAFHIDIPVFRIVFALVLIYIGVRMLFGSLGFRSVGPFKVRGEESLRSSISEGSRSYRNVFGDESIDLTDIVIRNRDVVVDIESVFGNTVVKVDPKIPTEFSVDAVFGNASVPGAAGVNFGSRNLGNDSLKEGKPRLRIRGKAVFGNLEFVEKVTKK